MENGKRKRERKKERKKERERQGAKSHKLENFADATPRPTQLLILSPRGRPGCANRPSFVFSFQKCLSSHRLLTARSATPAASHRRGLLLHASHHYYE